MKTTWMLLALLGYGNIAFTQEVHTQYGPVTGKQQGITFEFLGIPFASPPTGELRWRPTIAPEPWTNALAVQEFPPACPQKHYLQGDTSYVLEGDEDCLYLNVWSPRLDGTYPVMVFIHGGGNQQGSSGELVGDIELYNGKNLAERGKVVVVTIQYRLGILGYLVHPGLAAENEEGIAGNYGVMDQIFALQWVQNNISKFGGDPTNVTIFGESAGGVNVGNLMTSPVAKGLFHKAIIESAIPVLNAYQIAQSEGIELVNEFIKTGDDQEKIAYMRSLPADELSRTLENPVQGGVVQQAWQPVVDQHLFLDYPNEVFQSGQFNQVPLIIGSNADEMRPGVPPVVTPGQVRLLINSVVPAAYRSEALALYPPGNNNAEAKNAYAGILTDGQFTVTTRRTAQCVSLHQTQPVWRYFFTHSNAFPAISDWGAFHGLELFYVFNNLENSLFAFGPWYTNADKQVQQAMLDYWTHFAYTGNPNDGLLPEWPKYDAATDCYLEIKSSPDGTQCGLRTEKCNFWDQLFALGLCTPEVSAINDPPIQSSFLSPNPSPGSVHIRLEDPSQILAVRIYTLTGQLVGIFHNQTLLDLHDLPDGTYLVWLNANGKRKVEKLVLIR